VKRTGPAASAPRAAERPSPVDGGPASPAPPGSPPLEPPPVSPAAGTSLGVGRLPTWVVGYALVYAVIAFGPWLPAGAARAVINLGLLPLSILTGLLALRVARDPRATPHERGAWGVLALAFACTALGDAGWALLETGTGADPTRSWVNVAYLAYYPFMLWGLLRFRHDGRDDRARLTFWIDAATVTVGGGMAIWHFGVRSALLGAPAGADPLQVATLTAFPVGDLLVLAGVAAILLRRPAGAVRRTLVLLSCGLLLNLLGDSIWAALSLYGGYETGGIADAFWLVQNVLLVAAADHERRRLAAPAPVAPGTAPGRDLLPFVAVVLGYGLLVAETLLNRHEGIGDLVAGAVGLTLLVMARQALLLRENTRLLHGIAARVSEARLSALVEHSSDVILVVTPDGAIRYASPSAQRVLSLRPEALVGHGLREYAHPEDGAALVAFLGRVATSTGAVPSIAWRFPRADGVWIRLESTATNLMDNPAIEGLVLNTRDVTERAALVEQLRHQAFHDPLTGLANRALFQDRVGHALARRHRDGIQVAVLFVDMDNFKTVNDSLGHMQGDHLLVMAAARLSRCVRDSDTVARLGGDEFGIVLEDADVAGVVQGVADRVQSLFQVPFQLAERDVVVGLSAGTAVAADGDTVEVLLRNADAAMYTAKGQGRGRHVMFEARMHTSALARLELQEDLRRAVERGEFSLDYQPIFRLSTGQVVGLEALLRWNHPTRGRVQPGAFIPIAEETGLIVPLGEWVVRRAVADAAPWCDGPLAHAAPSVTVNLSGRQVQSPGLAEVVKDALARTGLPASRLVLEITESVLMQKHDASTRVLHDLKALGVRLAIDDFGTGYSSLHYLERFPLDLLKIPKDFIDGLSHHTSRDDAGLAGAIVAIARTLGLSTVAEGVETTTQLRRLSELGCDYAQGFLLGRPMPEPEVQAFLAAGGDWHLEEATAREVLASRSAPTP